MGRRITRALVLILPAGIGGFVLGAWWYSGFALEPPPGPRLAPIAVKQDRAPRPVRGSDVPAASQPTASVHLATESSRFPEVTASSSSVLRELSAARAELKLQEEQRD